MLFETYYPLTQLNPINVTHREAHVNFISSCDDLFEHKPEQIIQRNFQTRPDYSTVVKQIIILKRNFLN